MTPPCSIRGNGEQIGRTTLPRNKTDRLAVSRPAGRRFGISAFAQLLHVTSVGWADVQVRTATLVPNESNFLAVRGNRRAHSRSRPMDQRPPGTGAQFMGENCRLAQFVGG